MSFGKQHVNPLALKLYNWNFHLKLRLSDATHSFKWVKIDQMETNDFESLLIDATLELQPVQKLLFTLLMTNEQTNIFGIDGYSVKKRTWVNENIFTDNRAQG